MSDANFTKWVKWAHIFENNESKWPGVYLLGQYDTNPPQIVSASDEHVIYIGETCGQTIAQRLRQFGKSGFEGKNGHSGGWTFADKFKVKDIPDWLYVSILPIKTQDPAKSAEIRYLERRLIWKYVQKWEQMPLCNKK